MTRSPFDISLGEMGRSALLLTPVVIEVSLLHALVTRYLGPNSVTFGFYARDILLPLLLGAYLYLCCLLRKTEVRLRFRPRGLALNLFFLLSSVALLVALGSGGMSAFSGGVMAAFFGLGLAAFFSSGFLFVSPLEALAAIRALGNRIGYAAAGLGLLICYPQMVTWAWSPLASLTAKTCETFLRLGAIPASAAVTANGTLELRHAALSVQIGLSCAGLEGMFFFAFFLFLIRTFEGRSPRWAREIFYFLAGVTFLFLLNVLRISVFFAVGLMLASHQDKVGAIQFILWAFHNNVGWVLYFAGMALLFRARALAKPPALAFA